MRSNGLTNLSVRRPILMTMILGSFLVFGIVSLFYLPIDLMPKIEFPYVTVRVIYPGAGPVDIETSVIKPIEEQLSTVSGIKNITSNCMEGVGFILLEFNLGVDAGIAAIDAKDKIDAIYYKLPRDLQKPIIGKFDMNSQPIMNLAITGPQDPEQLRHITENDVKEQILKVMGVASATVTGGHEREIQINLHKERLEAIGQSVASVAAIISTQNSDMPAGHISGDNVEYTIRVVGQYQSLDDIGNLKIQVKKSGGSGGNSSGGGGGGSGNNGGGGSGGGGGGDEQQYVPLSTIAEIVDSYKEVREKARFNMENCVGLAIQKNPDANTVVLAEDIFKRIDVVSKTLPPGVKINIVQDRSKYIRDSVHERYVDIAIGVLLTAFMLFLFLGDWRLMIIATIVIPGSVLMTFLGMRIFGFSLNMVTLMALGIAIGQLVTDAIIIIEAIVRHRDEGMPIKEAAISGTSEVIIAVIASALTHSAVFLPIATMQGITGQIFKALGLTIVTAVMASLLFSLTLTPMMASLLLKNRKLTDTGEKKLNFAEKMMQPLQIFYVNSLKWALNNKVIVILFTAGIFIGTLLGVTKFIGKEFFPKSDEGTLTIELQMPSGASLGATDRAMHAIEQRVSTIPEIKTVYSALGGSGSNTGINMASLIIQLKDKKERKLSTIDVEKKIRPLLSEIPDAKIITKAASSMRGGGGNADIQVEITGDIMSEIIDVANAVKAKALLVPGLADVKISYQEAKPEIKFIPDRLKLDEYGVSITTFGTSIRNAMSGNEASLFRQENDEYTIRVQLNPAERTTIDDIENITVPTNKGLVAIKTLANVTYESGAANIDRKNRQRLVMVTANVVTGTSGTKAAELKKLTNTIKVKPGYKIFYGGQQERMNESFMELAIALILAIVLVYMVLAGSLESLTQPVLMLLTLPLGLVGVIWALFLTGNSISMISIMSIIMLIGVVVNNAILICDFAYHKLNNEGLSVFDSIVEACKTKFVAIIMMNLAIILASLPQALAVGTISSPFAITAIGGVIVSTIMTFYVIPVTYVMTAKKRKVE